MTDQDTSSKVESMSKEDAVKLLKEEALAVGAARQKALNKILARLEDSKGKTILKEEMQRQRALRKSREDTWKHMKPKKAKISKLASHFSAYDVDDSNTIDMDEFKLLCKDLMMKQENLVESFKKIDTDGSGEIEFEEFKAWYEKEKRASSAGKRMSRFFKKKIKDLGSLCDAAHARKAIIKEVIAKSDAVTKAEFAKKHPQIKAARALAPPVSRPAFPKKSDSILNAEREAESVFNKDTAELLKESNHAKDLDTNHDGVLSTAELVVALDKNDDSAIDELGNMRKGGHLSDDSDDDENSSKTLSTQSLDTEKQVQLEGNAMTTARVISPIADDIHKKEEAERNAEDGQVTEVTESHKSSQESGLNCCQIV